MCDPRSGCVSRDPVFTFSSFSSLHTECVRRLSERWSRRENWGEFSARLRTPRISRCTNWLQSFSCMCGFFCPNDGLFGSWDHFVPATSDDGIIIIRRELFFFFISLLFVYVWLPVGACEFFRAHFIPMDFMCAKHNLCVCQLNIRLRLSDWVVAVFWGGFSVLPSTVCMNLCVFLCYAYLLLLCLSCCWMQRLSGCRNAFLRNCYKEIWLFMCFDIYALLTRNTLQAGTKKREREKVRGMKIQESHNTHKTHTQR